MPWGPVKLTSSASRMFASRGSTTQAYLYTSTDAINWSSLTNGGLRYWSSIDCNIDGSTIIACEAGINATITGSNVWVSTNTGTTWRACFYD